MLVCTFIFNLGAHQGIQRYIKFSCNNKQLKVAYEQKGIQKYEVAKTDLLD